MTAAAAPRAPDAPPSPVVAAPDKEEDAPQREARRLPSAMVDLERVVDVPGGARLAIFFDYDGTLTPIVRRPDLAVLDPEMRRLLQRLSARWPVAILSGRDLDDVREKVGLDGLWYAGSHGFDRAGPDGRREVVAAAEPLVAPLSEAADQIEMALKGHDGVWVERKRFAVAVHYREADPAVEGPVGAAVTAAAEARPGRRVKGGKKILELQPDIPWHKGAALRHMAKALDLDLRRDRVLYLGDDETDEDAFAAVGPAGFGILVRDEANRDRTTRAQYALDGVDAVRRFLEAVASAGAR